MHYPGFFVFDCFCLVAIVGLWACLVFLDKSENIPDKKVKLLEGRFAIILIIFYCAEVHILLGVSLWGR